MSAIEFDPFSKLRSPMQGLTVADLTRANKPFLEAHYPGTARRYRDYPHALKNVARQACQEGFKPFIIRSGEFRVACGLATIIRNVTVKHPSGMTLRGTDLDYWLDEEHQGLHDLVADKLIEKSRAMARASVEPTDEGQETSAPHTYFTKQPAEGVQPGMGLLRRMTGQLPAAVLDISAAGETIIEPSDQLLVIHFNEEKLKVAQSEENSARA